MSKEYAVVVKPYSVEVRQIQCTLENLQRMVGGYIETVTIRINGKPYVMVIDEEGKLKGKAYNPLASLVYRYDQIVGDAVVVTAGEEDLKGLTFDAAAEFMDYFRAAVNRSEALDV